MKTGNKVKVLFAGRFNQSEVLSGPEKTAKRIFGRHLKNNPGIFVEYFFDGNRYSLMKKLFGREVTKENVMRLGLFRIIPQTFSFKPQIIHIVTYERFAVMLLLCKMFSDVKIIYNVHGNITIENNTIRTVSFLYRLKDKICEGLFLKFSDKIVFYSERSMDLTESYCRLDEQKAVILSGGIDEEFHESFFLRLSEEPRTFVRVGSGDLPNVNSLLKIVIMSDSLLVKTGLRMLKDVIRNVKHPVEFYLVGNVMSSDLGSSSGITSVRFINKMDTCRLAGFYSDKNIYLSVRDFETFSLNAVEAMAAGLIPIVSEGTGMSRYIVDGENGFRADNVDPEMISRLIDSIGNDSQLRGALSENAAKIYDILSWDNVYETFTHIYSELTKRTLN